MNIGDKVLISPDLTHSQEWIEGKVIEIEENKFAGIVVSAEISNGDIFFGHKELFKEEESCTH